MYTNVKWIFCVHHNYHHRHPPILVTGIPQGSASVHFRFSGQNN